MAPKSPNDPDKPRKAAGKAQPKPGADETVEVAPTLKVPLKKKDFLERVVERSGLRRNDAKTAVDAVLAVLGEALAAGEEVNLPPFGKAKRTREKTTPRGHAYTIRLVRNLADISAQETLAPDDKDS